MQEHKSERSDGCLFVQQKYKHMSRDRQGIIKALALEDQFEGLRKAAATALSKDTNEELVSAEVWGRLATAMEQLDDPENEEEENESMEVAMHILDKFATEREAGLLPKNLANMIPPILRSIQHPEWDFEVVEVMNEWITVMEVTEELTIEAEKAYQQHLNDEAQVEEVLLEVVEVVHALETIILQVQQENGEEPAYMAEVRRGMLEGEIQEKLTSRSVDRDTQEFLMSRNKAKELARAALNVENMHMGGKLRLGKSVEETKLSKEREARKKAQRAKEAADRPHAHNIFPHDFEIPDSGRDNMSTTNQTSSVSDASSSNRDDRVDLSYYSEFEDMDNADLDEDVDKIGPTTTKYFPFLESSGISIRDLVDNPKKFDLVKIGIPKKEAKRLLREVKKAAESVKKNSKAGNVAKESGPLPKNLYELFFKLNIPNSALAAFEIRGLGLASLADYPRNGTKELVDGIAGHGDAQIRLLEWIKANQEALRMQKAQLEIREKDLKLQQRIFNQEAYRTWQVQIDNTIGKTGRRLQSQIEDDNRDDDFEQEEERDRRRIQVESEVRKRMDPDCKTEFVSYLFVAREEMLGDLGS